MKIIICLLALVTAAFAAAPTVVVDANLNCLVNGSDWGKPGDVIVNNRDNAELVVAVNVALMAHLNKVKADSTAANAAAAASIATATAAEKTRADAAIAAANAAKQSQAAAVTARQAAESAMAAETARVAAIVAALKGVSPTLLPANVRAELRTAQEKERDTLLAQKAALDAQVAALP